MRHWNRGRKTVRNFLLVLLMIFLVYASQGFPPYTVRGMCRRVSHDFLLGELEPLYVQRDWLHPSSNRYLRYTTVAARSGETYTIFRYRDGLLGSQRDWGSSGAVLGEGAVCRARNGTIYAAGPFEEAVSAVAEVRAERTLKTSGRVMGRTFTLEGTRLADQVFAFSYGTADYFGSQDEDRAYGEMSLEELVDLWYRRPLNKLGYAEANADLPCTVTLYDEAGEALETFDLTVTTDQILSGWM